jgi:hypothetical protein
MMLADALTFLDVRTKQRATQAQATQARESVWGSALDWSRLRATRPRRHSMSILVRFTGAPGLTTDQYDQTMPRIAASGEFPPDGLDYHVAFSSGGSFRVSEIWDSQEQFEAFSQRLMPILSEAGIELAGPPEIVEIHNIIKR